MIYRFIGPMLFTFRKLFVYYRGASCSRFSAFLCPPRMQRSVGSRHFLPRRRCLWSRRFGSLDAIPRQKYCLNRSQMFSKSESCSFARSSNASTTSSHAESDVLLLFSAFVQFDAWPEKKPNKRSRQTKTVQFNSRFRSVRIVSVVFTFFSSRVRLYAALKFFCRRIQSK